MSQGSGATEHRVFAQHSRTPHGASSSQNASRHRRKHPCGCEQKARVHGGLEPSTRGRWSAQWSRTTDPGRPFRAHRDLEGTLWEPFRALWTLQGTLGQPFRAHSALEGTLGSPLEHPSGLEETLGQPLGAPKWPRARIDQPCAESFGGSHPGRGKTPKRYIQLACGHCCFVFRCEGLFWVSEWRNRG